jgi:hypothetical protein
MQVSVSERAGIRTQNQWLNFTMTLRKTTIEFILPDGDASSLLLQPRQKLTGIDNRDIPKDT